MFVLSSNGDQELTEDWIYHVNLNVVRGINRRLISAIQVIDRELTKDHFRNGRKTSRMIFASKSGSLTEGK